MQNNKSLLQTADQKKKNVLFDFPRVSPGDQPLTKKPDDSGIETSKTIKKIPNEIYQGGLTIIFFSDEDLKKLAQVLQVSIHFYPCHLKP